MTEIQPITLTAKEAAKRHSGITAKEFQRLCLRGKCLSKVYGGWSRVPEREKATALAAKKTPAGWVIAVSELDRFFLP